ARLMQNPSVLSADVGAAVVLLHVERNAYFDTDGVGAEIWRRLTTPITVAEICEALRASYEVEPATCEGDVLAFLEAALAEDVVCIDKTASA
ncbi:MAG: PqqD family protein, partial [Vicinamibacterales bacterium]